MANVEIHFYTLCLHCVAGGISRLRVIMPAFPFLAGARLPADQLQLHPRLQGAEKQRRVQSGPLLRLLSEGTVRGGGKEHGEVKMSDLYDGFLSFLLLAFSSGMFFSLGSPLHSLALLLSFVSARLSSFSCMRR